jgi:D-amino peptidase
VIFLSGDAALCGFARSLIHGITTVPVNEGTGDSVVSIHPDEAIIRIRENTCIAVRKAVREPKYCAVPTPETFDVRVRYSTHQKASRSSLYPGAKQNDEKTTGFSAKDYIEVLRFFKFVL